VDTATGLERTGNNRARYQRLLRRFAEQAGSPGPEIRAALTALDGVGAARIAHSLKGSAGNLGADALAEHAARMEAAIKEGAITDVLLDDLDASLQRVVQAIHTALPSEGTPEGDQSAAPADPATAVGPLQRLKQLLANDDTDVVDALAEERATLSAVLHGDELAALTDAVENYDFESGLTCLATVTRRLALTLE
jgi:HPt (histidine-containing phosphotransfer) domain-containing protein